MALALTVEKIESVPEAQRALYVEKEGKFHLDVDGIEDTSGLKSALEKERAAVKAQKAELAEFKKSGKSPAEIAEFVAEQTKAAEEAAKKAGNFDALMAQHKAAAAKEKADLIAERDAAFGIERSAIVENKVMTALTKAKATSEGMDLLTERLGKRIHFETVEGKRVISIMQADGKTPLAGSGTDGAATFDDLVKEAVKQYPSLFEGTGAGGGGKQPNGKDGKTNDKTMTRADWDKLPPFEQAAKAKAGVKLVD